MNVIFTETQPGPVVSVQIHLTVSELSSLIAAIALVPTVHSSHAVLLSIAAAFPQVQPSVT